MSVFFIVSVNIPDSEQRAFYDAYISKVKPVVESFGGRYVVRSEKISVFAGIWRPDRVIVVEFDTQDALELCFGSPEYQAVKGLREMSVKASAIIVET